MGRPKGSGKKKEKDAPAKKPKKVPLTDLLEGKFCIAREHIDGHIETWTDLEEFKRLEAAFPKHFDSKDEANEYVELFKDSTADFSDDAINPICVVPLKRFLSHTYTISIVEAEEGVLRPEIDIDVAIKGKGTSWKDAVESARRPFVDQVTVAITELDAFMDQRLAEERILEQKANEAKSVLQKLDNSLKQFSAV